MVYPFVRKKIGRNTMKECPEKFINTRGGDVKSSWCEQRLKN